MWMVRVRFDGLPQVREDDSQTVDMVLTVDPSGEYQFADVTQVASSTSEFLRAKMEINRMDISPAVGNRFFKGKGTANVLFVADPFCPFCRNQFSYLMKIKDKIGELKLLHMPMPNLHPSAMIACAVLSYAQETVKEEEYAKIVEFAYTVLEEKIPPSSAPGKSALPTQEQEMEIVKSFLTAFPELGKGKEFENLFYFIKGKYTSVVERENNIAINQFKFRGTPNTFVNGYLIRGYSTSELDIALGL
jgi:protein-disulfide isomerase